MPRQPTRHQSRLKKVKRLRSMVWGGLLDSLNKTDVYGERFKDDRDSGPGTPSLDTEAS